MAHRKFNPGDKVRILPSWWEELASGEYAMENIYVKNGIDHIYTILSCSGGKIYLDGLGGFWDQYHLIPADEEPVEESEISIDGLL